MGTESRESETLEKLEELCFGRKLGSLRWVHSQFGTKLHDLELKWLGLADSNPNWYDMVHMGSSAHLIGNMFSLVSFEFVSKLISSYISTVGQRWDVNPFIDLTLGEKDNPDIPNLPRNLRNSPHFFLSFLSNFFRPKQPDNLGQR